MSLCLLKISPLKNHAAQPRTILICHDYYLFRACSYLYIYSYTGSGAKL